ncbi:MAG: amidohydrolase family protein [bacterium]|nr:amidohydrolase family protein [bacterium]
MHPVIDCDIHNTVPNTKALYPYLSDYWQDQLEQTGFGGASTNAYPASARTSIRPDAKPDTGPPGSNLDLLREHTLDAWNAELGILTCNYAVDSIPNPDAALALAQAVNDWQIAEWLDKEPRLRASLVVPPQFPDLAIQEINRLGNHPGFVQIFLPVRSPQPYGNRNFHPLFAAAVTHNLALALHFGGNPGNPPTPSGWSTFYIEEYTGMASVFQSQLLSLISGGAFNQFPDLRVVLLESGCTWLPSLMWRFDKDWKGIRREMPWLKQPPTEYIHKHIRLTIQPFDAPANIDQLSENLEQMGSDNLLLFATDYPHMHFHAPEDALPKGLPDSLIPKIMHENARAFYGFST